MAEIKEEIEVKGKSILAKAGTWSFMGGVIIALIIGLAIGAGALKALDSPDAGDTEGYVASVLVILGFVVGIVSALGLGSITKEEVTAFLVAAIALVAVGTGAALFGKIPLIGSYFSGITGCMLVFFAPAAVIVAIKALWDLGKE
jgi:uncharacterized membrane protein